MTIIREGHVVRIITTLLDVAGIAAITVGAYVVFGMGWALIVAGMFVLAASYIAAGSTASGQAEVNGEEWAG